MGKGITVQRKAVSKLTQDFGEDGVGIFGRVASFGGIAALAL